MRQLKAEFYKMRHTFLFSLHVIVPVAAGVLFLAWTRISAQLQFSVFVQAVGVVFPVLASVICAGNMELELSGHLQGFLMTAGKRESILGAVILYGVGNRTILGDMEIPFSVFLKAGVFLWLGSLPLYLEHLFLNLCFSKTVSVAVSIGQILISALFLTGLGQGKWQYFPCSWSSRGTSLYLAEKFNRRAALGAANTDLRDILTCILLGTVLCVIIFIWFHFYEGREVSE